MSIFSKLSYKSRKQKLGLFYDTFRPDSNTKILDLGGEIDPEGKSVLQLIDSYEWKNNITALNISSDHIDKIKNYYPEVNGVVGDACSLPWEDNYFDVVYSNAVIEHVGGLENQRKMASEIMRVGKNWFVTTPNRFYPFEFHMRLPFVTWLPGELYLYAGILVSYNHAKNRYSFFNTKRDYLRLMSTSEFQTCFRGSRIIKQKITFWPETLIAVSANTAS